MNRDGFTLLKNNLTSPWLDQLNFDWSEILHLGKKVTFKKDSILYHAGDPIDFVYIILYGRVQLYLIHEDGKEKALAIIGKNGLLGEYKKQKTNDYLTSAQTVSDATLVIINKSTFEKYLFDNKILSKQRLEMLSLKLEVIANSALQLSYDSSLHRVVRVFLNLAYSYGKEADDGTIKINMTFTHQEIAYLIGSTRVTVANVIKSLIDQQLIKKKGKYYYILEKNKLLQLL